MQMKFSETTCDTTHNLSTLAWILNHISSEIRIARADYHSIHSRSNFSQRLWRPNLGVIYIHLKQMGMFPVFPGTGMVVRLEGERTRNGTEGAPRNRTSRCQKQRSSPWLIQRQAKIAFTEIVYLLSLKIDRGVISLFGGHALCGASRGSRASKQSGSFSRLYIQKGLNKLPHVGWMKVASIVNA